PPGRPRRRRAVGEHPRRGGGQGPAAGRVPGRRPGPGREGPGLLDGSRGAGARVAMTAAGVLTVTANAAVDHTVWIPGFRAGEVNRVQDEDRSPGGKGVNVAAALRALNVDVDATGFLGRDNDGLFAAFFADAGI